MKDVTDKQATRREALAETKLLMPPEIQTMLRERRLEKGDALEIARVAGAMGAKKTWEVIPFCHPLPITGVDVTYEFEPDGVRVRALVKTIAVTGVEMEALTASSLAALTLYDMLKPHTQEIEIAYTRLLSKKGGKSGDYEYRPR
ncbi:MAG: cyclic pyranopterin monophosphate synthase MoaC [Anaerolinea sp.]|nr:cyclic pyranopterin monophosphate synthase MoaC [Anaerolinea sp.]MCC6972884.1 cyclic pyranopterin monophosphate synthase MoaC [Anaerolineae bacterium]CAG0995439.1 cyclic pyranopterin monophosphate synthase [Anaerolineae bacterium]